MSDSIMVQPAQILRIVVASPGDVQGERHVVSAVVDQVNRGVARERGLVLEVKQWEKDAFPGFHSKGPQAIIDSILGIRDCDIFLGIFWRRFGTPVSDAKSGTEHEYNLAYEAWKKKGRPQIFFYFNQRAYSPKTRDETDQWGMVLEFRRNFPQEGLWWPYTGKEKFRGLLRDHLENFLRAQYPLGASAPSQSSPQPPPAAALNALHQLPPRPADFTGREDELKELFAAIQDEGVAISCLHGMGGIGKTALALKLAEQLTPHYPDGQIFLDLGGVSEKPLTAADALFYVVRAFHPEAKLPEGEAELAATYRSTLHGKRCLLVMDNARDAAHVAPLVPPVGSKLIVTSRLYLEIAGLSVKSLGTLPPAHACSLLLAIAPRIGVHAQPLAKLCGYLPLALRSVASTLNKRIDVTAQDYVERLAAGREKLEPVDASFGLSYDLLGTHLQKLFRAVAVFPETFDAQAAAAVWGLDPDPTHAALGDLLAYSLLEWNADLQRYRLHDLTRAFAATKLGAEEQATSRYRHAAHYEVVTRATSALYSRGGEYVQRALRLFDAEFGNIKAGQSWAASHAGNDDQAARLASKYSDAGADLLSLRQHPRQQILWLEPALAAARRLKDRRTEGIHLGNLGSAWAHLGQMRPAIEYLEQALAIDREIGDLRGQAQNLCNLGNAYAQLGEPSRAIQIWKSCLGINHGLRDRRGEANILGNLGNAYADLAETRYAIQYHTESLAIHRDIGDRRGEAINLGNLGVAHEHLAEIRPAIEFHEMALKIFRELGDRRSEGSVLGNLSLAYANLGEIDRAIRYSEQRLAIGRETGDRRGEAAALSSLGLAYRQLGEPARAIEYHKEALEIDREIGNRRGQAGDMGNLALVYAELGDPRRAIELYEQCLAIHREMSDRRGEGNDLGNLGNAYKNLSEPRRAIGFYEKALAVARDIGDRQGEGNSLWNMSLALDSVGERSKAIVHATAALTIRQQIEDPTAEKVRRQLDDWGSC